MRIPDLIGKYRVERRLGGGGMAEVFLAEVVGAEGFSRKVAIKRVLPGYADNASFEAHFIAEARLSSQLHHPNIVSILDFDRDLEQGLFLVMELVEGRDLAQLLSAGPLPLSLTLHIIAEVLRGLGHAHHPPEGEPGFRGLVHRDISPHNVLLSWEGEVKVSDFGLAKSLSASHASASVTIKGKPSYMSPEQANGEDLDGRSDLFAVGAMLWEMLVGRSLFGRSSLSETLAAIFFAPIASPSSLRPEVPEQVGEIALRLLDRDRAARYATAEAARQAILACPLVSRDGRAELSALLQAHFGGRSVDRARAEAPLARRKPPVAPASRAAPAAEALPRRSSSASLPYPRRRLIARLGIVVAVVVLCAVAITAGLSALASARRNDEPSAPPAAAPAPLPDAGPAPRPDAGAAPPDGAAAPRPTDKPRPPTHRRGRANKASDASKSDEPSGIVDLSLEEPSPP